MNTTELTAPPRKIIVLLGPTPAATSALNAYQKTTQFEKIDETVLAGIDRARGIMKGVKDGLDL